ncbi:MAG TPA: ATP-binding cassette domain-containing protein [Candidatus Eremiobacteraceae bacterium]|nr:ATP-binding cassette domain-containing protein [Candidatus Eremiobacteraceae bacterium]
MTYPESAAVEARDLTKRYGTFEAVRGIDFRIAPRECFGFLGVNGAGKTSTMKMIYCRTTKSSGTLDVLGMDAATHPQTIKRRIGVVTQESALDPELTVEENVLLYAAFFGIRGAAARAKCASLLHTMNLESKARARIAELSGGMKRRLAIARGLVNDPEMMVLDEPTTGLDPQARLLMWHLLLGLRERGITLILTTHYMEEAARLCDRLVIMDEGKILAAGTPRELVERYAAADVLEVIGVDPETIGPFDGLIRRRERHGETTYLYNDDNRVLLRRLAERGVEAVRHVARPATLEDVFLNLTGRELEE